MASSSPPPEVFTGEQLDSFIRDSLAPRSQQQSSSFNPRQHIRTALQLSDDEDVLPEHYQRFLRQIVMADPLTRDAWHNHLDQWPGPHPGTIAVNRAVQQEEDTGGSLILEQKYGGEDLDGVEVQILSVREVPLNSLTGGAAQRIERLKRGGGGELSPSSWLGGQYMGQPMFRDEGDCMRTEEVPKLLLVEMRLKPAVHKYLGHKPEHLPATKFILSQDHYDQVCKAPNLRFPREHGQPWAQDLAIGPKRSVDFGIASEDANDIADFAQQNQQDVWPPTWVGATIDGRRGGGGGHSHHHIEKGMAAMKLR